MGLKARSSRPVELSMSAGGGGFSNSATIDLASGHCRARVSSKDWSVKNSKWVTREVECTIPESGMVVLRATASEILSSGDTEYREQFAQQGVSFSARSRTHSATADFQIDVGVGTRYDRAWDKVFGVVNAITRSSKFT